MKTSAKRRKATAPRGVPNAVDLLVADHKKVKAMFKRFSKLKEEGSDEDKTALVMQICNELKVHTRLEEEIFYPAVREATDDDDLVDEAIVEHAGAKDLIQQLESGRPSDDLYDAKVTVLGEQIDHHVKEEEKEMFPKARKKKVDLAALAEQITARKQALMAELGMADPSPDAEKVSTSGRSRARSGTGRSPRLSR